MPLESTRDHIEFIINQIENWDKEEVVYPIARNNLILSANNHINGLKIINNLITKTIIKPATEKLDEIQAKGTVIDLETIIRKYYSKQVVDYYRTAERFNENFNNQKKPFLPFEIYYWIDSIMKDIGLETKIIIEASNQFVNHSFNDSIIEPLSASLEIGGGSIIPGSLKTIDVSDIFSGYKINDGYVISYIRGEFRNILLWPILIHEMFHILDREKKIVENLLKRKKIPPLSVENAQNLKWLTELVMDIFSAKYFGPAYLLSLQTYFERLPYVGQTLDHPEMALRLKAVQMYMNDSETPYTDIFDKCKSACSKMTSSRINAVIKAEKYSGEKEEQITTIFKAISEYFDELGLPSFRMELKKYLLKSEAKETEKDFIDPLYDFDEIKELLLDNAVSLALDPRIILNVVMAQYEKLTTGVSSGRFLSERHYEIITDSLLKWKIEKEWRKAISS
jgi:hypothetical protein